jgi:hypothetical protein
VWGATGLVFAQETAKAGIARMIQHTSPSEGSRRGVTPEDMKAINALGYLSSTYDVYADILPIEPGQAVTLNHEFLTADRAAQRTRFSDGTIVVVNFGEPYAAKVGGKTYVLPQNGFAAKGPRIEQSLALEGGKAVTRIRAGRYQYADAGSAR